MDELLATQKSLQAKLDELESNSKAASTVPAEPVPPMETTNESAETNVSAEVPLSNPVDGTAAVSETEEKPMVEDKPDDTGTADKGMVTFYTHRFDIIIL